MIYVTIQYLFSWRGRESKAWGHRDDAAGNMGLRSTRFERALRKLVLVLRRRCTLLGIPVTVEKSLISSGSIMMSRLEEGY